MKNYLIIGGTKGIGLKTIELLGKDCKIYSVSRGRNEDRQQNIAHYQLDITKDDLSKLDALPVEIHGLVYCPEGINLRPFSRFSETDFLNDFIRMFSVRSALSSSCFQDLKRRTGAVLCCTVR
jgi:3-oxoacyl-[acyl-carrier protein] reductase